MKLQGEEVEAKVSKAKRSKEVKAKNFEMSGQKKRLVPQHVYITPGPYFIYFLTLVLIAPIYSSNSVYLRFYLK